MVDNLLLFNNGDQMVEKNGSFKTVIFLMIKVQSLFLSSYFK